MNLHSIIKNVNLERLLIFGFKDPLMQLCHQGIEDMY